MADNKLNSIVLEDVRIVFRNFAGKEGQYNREGDRNFAVLLDEEKASEMERAGWNVKELRPREEGDSPQPYIQVAVNYKGKPPRIVMVTSRGRTPLSEEEVDVLDWADIASTDLIIRPYEWTVNGKSGVKAYLQSLFANINEDELELKYSDVPDSNQGLPASPWGEE